MGTSSSSRRSSRASRSTSSRGGYPSSYRGDDWRPRGAGGKGYGSPERVGHYPYREVVMAELVGKSAHSKAACRPAALAGKTLALAAGTEARAAQFVFDADSRRGSRLRRRAGVGRERPRIDSEPRPLPGSRRLDAQRCSELDGLARRMGRRRGAIQSWSSRALQRSRGHVLRQRVGLPWRFHRRPTRPSGRRDRPALCPVARRNGLRAPVRTSERCAREARGASRGAR